MFNRLKGKFSAYLLSAKSHHTISQANLIFALGLAVMVAVLSGIFAFAQWRVTGNLLQLQEEQERANEQHIGILANMATLQANTHRATLNILLSRDPAEFGEADALRRINLHNYADLTARLGSMTNLSDNADKLQSLTQQYEKLSDHLVELLQQNRREEAYDLRVTRLRELFNHWQNSHEGFSKQLAQANLDQQSNYDASTAEAKRWLVRLLLAPLVLIVLGIGAIATILSVERLGGRRKDSWTQ